MDPSLPLVVGSILTPISTMLIIMFNARQARLRREENRKWEIEDRAELARKVLATSETLARRVEQSGTELTTHIEKATDAAHRAFKEANDVNGKIEDLNRRLLQRDKEEH